MAAQNRFFGPKGRNARRLNAARFMVPAVVENKYVLGLQRLFGHVHELYFEHANPNFRHDGYSYRDATLQALGVRIKAAVRKPIQELATSAAQGVERANRLALQKVTPESMGLHPDIQAFRERNVQLATAALEEFGTAVRDVLEDPDNVGVAWTEVRKQLVEKTNMSKWRAEVIARDQTNKLNANINQARQVRAGVEKYIWSTSHDERVRASHRELDGQTFSWLNPPIVDDEPANPGEPIMCRCIALPVFDDID